MRGVFVSNAYLRGRKYSEPWEMLSSAAASMGVELMGVTNAGIGAPVGDRDTVMGILGDPDFVLFWDKDTALAGNLEVCGLRVFNSSRCIGTCDDKLLTHLALVEEGVPSIETVVCPLSFSGYDDLSFLDPAAERLGFPMVVKDRFGSFGMQVRLAHDMDALRGMFSGPYVPRILQRYIECSATDIRAEVVGGEVVESVIRHGPEGDFRSNATIGGRMERHSITEDERELAIRASEAVGADFCGVDIIRSDDGPVVCEVNSNAHIRNLRECTGHDVSYDILEHIIRQLG